MDAWQTIAGMEAWAAAKGADLAFHVGDLSYATGYLGKWETYMNAIEVRLGQHVSRPSD